MTTTPEIRLPLAAALAAAEALRSLLATACNAVEIAGSVRRRKSDCKDIELVCVPLPAAGGSLFDAETDPFGQAKNALDLRVERLIANGELSRNTQNPKNGRRYKTLIFRGTPVDLFVCEAASFGYILALRTGPADFSKRIVTETWNGGLLPSGFRCRDGSVWRGETRIAVPTEESFFELLGSKWIPPEARP